MGWAAEAALSKDVAERRDVTGFATPSMDYTADESRVVKMYRFMFGASGEAGVDERFDIGTYREYLRRRAALARPGDDLTVLMPIPRKKTVDGEPMHMEVRIVYQKHRGYPH
jgi:hypothetical protein